MSPVFGVFVMLFVLGVAFFGVARFSPPALRDRDFWITAVVATLTVTFLVAALTGELRVWVHPTTRQLRELSMIAVVVGLLTAEAVLVSRWTLDRGGLRDAFSFLAVFTLGTVAVWFLTALCLWVLVPWV